MPVITPALSVPDKYTGFVLRVYFQPRTTDLFRRFETVLTFSVVRKKAALSDNPNGQQKIPFKKGQLSQGTLLSNYIRWVLVTDEPPSPIDARLNLYIEILRSWLA